MCYAAAASNAAASPVVRANAPTSKLVQCVCHDTLPWFISVSLGQVVKFYETKLTANSCIALCSSTNAVNISSARTMKSFPSLRLGFSS